MNKRGQTGPLWQTVIYTVLVAVFLVLIFGFIYQQTNGAAIWEEYYAKKIASIINLAGPGDEIVLDVQKISEIAYKNKVSSLNDMVAFDNLRNEVCISLSSSGKSCYRYYNSVDIQESEIVYGEPVNLLSFRISEDSNE